jgi:hypothetical protein
MAKRINAYTDLASLLQGTPETTAMGILHIRIFGKFIFFDRSKKIPF